MKTATLKIDGMYCDGCARTIESIIAAEPGVRQATVSFDSREARFLFDPQVANEDRVMATIRSAGYSVTRPTG